MRNSQCKLVRSWSTQPGILVPAHVPPGHARVPGPSGQPKWVPRTSRRGYGGGRALHQWMRLDEPELCIKPAGDCEQVFAVHCVDKPGASFYGWALAAAGLVPSDVHTTFASGSAALIVTRNGACCCP